MSTLVTLIKREFWENKGSFFKLPIIFGGIVLFVATCYTILLCTHVVHYSVQGQSDFIGQMPATFTADVFYGMSAPFWIMLWLVVFYYFLGSLYDDRKNRSILFWQSMPIAEWETVASKVITAMIIAPLCTWICIVVTELIFLVILTIAVSILGFSSVGGLWSPLMILSAWFQLLGVIYLQLLWLFPLFGWCMLCSAYAKKSPFLTAAIPYVVLVLIEAIFYRHGHMMGYVVSRISNAWHSWMHLFVSLDSNISVSIFAEHPQVKHMLMSYGYGINSLYWSLAIGAGFVSIAGYLRYKGFRLDD